MLRSKNKSKYKSIGLGLECSDNFKNFSNLYNLAQSEELDFPLTAQKAILTNLIENSISAEFYILENSKAQEIVADSINNKIITIKDLSIFAKQARKRSFLICSNEEYENFKKLPEVAQQRILSRTNIINTGKLLAFATATSEILKIAQVIHYIKGPLSKNNLLRPLTDEDKILSELLYIFTDRITSIIIFHPRDISPYITTSPPKEKWYEQPFNIAESHFSYVVHNKKDKYTIIYPRVFANTSFDYRDKKGLYRSTEPNYFYNKSNSVFLFGKPSSQPSNNLHFKPFIIWCPHCTGTTRFYPLFVCMTKQFGITEFSASRIPAVDIDKLTPKNKADFCQLFFPTLRDNSYLYTHHTHHDFGPLFDDKKIPIILLVRDFRDVLISEAHWAYNVFRRDDEDFWLEFMNLKYEDNENRLHMRTKTMVQLADRENVIMIKFEEIDDNPTEAYNNFFQKLGLRSHPHFNKSMDEYLQTKIKEALPENYKRPELRKGKPGGWRKVFTPKMKELFKKNSNGYLQAFGYEKDDNW